jgi:hypothetical protein
VVNALEGDGETIVGPDRVGQELWFAGGEGGGGRHDRRRTSAVGGPTRGDAQAGDRARPFLGESLVDAERWIPHAESGGGVGLRIEVDHEGVEPPGPGRGREAERDRRLADAALLVDHREYYHADNVSNPRPSRPCVSRHGAAQELGRARGRRRRTGFRAGDTGGSGGLGLAIAKRIVEWHMARIEVTNRPEGDALVRVLLPRHTPA